MPQHDGFRQELFTNKFISCTMNAAAFMAANNRCNLMNRRRASMLDSYKCSNCGGYMTFDASLGKLRCLSCKQEEVVEDYEAEFESYACQDESNVYHDGEARQYLCRQCGSAVVTDNRSAVSDCPFCGNQMTLGERLSGEDAPAQVVPFRISEKEAAKAFRKWRRKLPFSPHDFPKGQEVGKVTGIYFPVMCYDLRAQGEVMVDALRRKKLVTPEDEREEISHYDLYRKNDLSFREVLVSNSGNVSDCLLEKMCPYDFEQSQSFSSVHLSRCFSEKNVKSPEEVFLSAQKKAEKYVEEYLLHSIDGYEEAAIDEKKYEIGKSAAKYVLLPVWLVMHHGRDEEYIFAMNGQTGKIASDPPVSWIKVATGAGLISLAVFLLFRIITLLLGGPLL